MSKLYPSEPLDVSRHTLRRGQKFPPLLGLVPRYTPKMGGRPTEAKILFDVPLVLDGMHSTKKHFYHVNPQGDAVVKR